MQLLAPSLQQYKVACIIPVQMQELQDKLYSKLEEK
jgi:hypothetical protein